MQNLLPRCGIILVLLFGISLPVCFEPQSASSEPLSPDSGGYVAIGRLERSRGGTREAPEYALFDHRGMIRYFVTPDTGMNVAEYLGQEVVLTGRAGPRTNNSVPQFLAKQIKSTNPMVETAVEPVASEPPTENVSQVAFQSEIPPADEVFGDVDVLPGEDPLMPMIESGGSCNSCGSTACGQSGCFSGYPNKFWLQADYLLWWTKGMWVPPLVTTSPWPVDRDQAGVLPDATILLGDEGLLKDSRSGFRLRGGTWFDPCHLMGFEGEFFSLGSATDSFSETSTGQPVLARPFNNINTPDDPEDAELVAYPDVIEGTVGVRATSDLRSVALNLRFNRCCQPLCWQLPGCSGRSVSGFRKMDVIMGYRYMRLDEGLSVTEDLNSLDDDFPSQFDILDQFETENRFHGGEIGLIYEVRGMRWSMEMRGKVALGNVSQKVTINGNTDITTGGTTLSYPSGILAQRTNINSYSRDQFAVIPELGVSLGYQLTPRLRAIFGYTFIYWNRVVRPGEHIDTVLNPNLFPPELNPLEGELRPRFAFDHTDFWAQGLNFGLHGEW